MGRMVVDVRLLCDPCLWCWEIRDAKDGRVVESSWAKEWVAFESADEAYAAGTRRLAELEAAEAAPRAGAGGRRLSYCA